MIGPLTGFERVVLFGDSSGVPTLLNHVSASRVVAIVGASLRPQHLSDLERLASEKGKQFLVQPKPDDAGYPSFLAQFEKLAPDLTLCHSYSMRLQPDILSITGGNAVNVHASLLPRNRGPNPLQWAIIRGETETGVSLHYMDEDFDSGDLVAQSKVAILPLDTWVTLHARIERATEQLLKDEIPAVLAGTNKRIAQDGFSATKNVRIGRDSIAIDFERMSDTQIYNLIRAQVAPLAGAYLRTRDTVIRFPDAVPLHEIAYLRRRHAI